MTDKLTVQSERIDDIPVLVTHQVHMGMPNLLDRLFASHGNRRGLSLGWLAVIWLTHIVSESDHLCEVSIRAHSLTCVSPMLLPEPCVRGYPHTALHRL